jgi:alkylhydroperoxidase family enzyme
MTLTARIPHLTAPYTPAVEVALAVMHPKSSPVDPLKLFRTMARNLPLGAAMSQLGPYMLGRTANFDMRSREIAIDRVTARCKCEYEWAVHVAGYAHRVGLTEDQVYSIVHGSASDDCWDVKDRAIVAMVDELHDTGHVTDATWTSLSAHFDENGLMEMLVLVGWYHAISFLANGARVELEDWAPRFPVKRETA